MVTTNIFMTFIFQNLWNAIYEIPIKKGGNEISAFKYMVSEW